ncbi:penicillin-binding protein activator LpoB [Sphingosinicellaceae bacterium]|nr:penicillin-binding protein activator LpoB [Sphingosinicellaceae bacterium]
MKILHGLAGTMALALAISPATAGKRSGHEAVDLDPSSRGVVTGTGLESRDIVGMADRLVRDLLQRPDFVNTAKPPRIIVDSSRLVNKSSQRLDTDMISDQLRAQLMRAAAGRIRFLSRENLQDVMDERELKRSGQVDVATKGMAHAVAGSDYKLTGRITSLDSRNNNTGMTQRAMQVVFEVIDLETSESVYISEPYMILRAQGDDVVYR